MLSHSGTLWSHAFLRATKVYHCGRSTWQYMVGQIFDSWCICCRSCLRPHVRWFWSGNASGTMGDSVASQNGYFAGFTYRTWMVVVINAFLVQVRMTCLRWPCLRSASSESTLLCELGWLVVTGGVASHEVC